MKPSVPDSNRPHRSDRRTPAFRCPARPAVPGIRPSLGAQHTASGWPSCRLRTFRSLVSDSRQDGDCRTSSWQIMFKARRPDRHARIASTTSISRRRMRAAGQSPCSRRIIIRLDAITWPLNPQGPGTAGYRSPLRFPDAARTAPDCELATVPIADGLESGQRLSVFLPSEPQKAQTRRCPQSCRDHRQIPFWIIDAAMSAFMGIGGRVFVGLIVSTVAFVYARNWLVRLRDGL